LDAPHAGARPTGSNAQTSGDGDFLPLVHDSPTLLLPSSNAVVPGVDLKCDRVVSALPHEFEGEER